VMKTLIGDGLLIGYFTPFEMQTGR